MKLNKDELIKLLNTQVKDYMGGDEFSAVIKGTVETMIAELQNDVQHPFDKQQTKQMIEFGNGSFKIDGGVMTTQKGSIINLNNKSNPWIAASQEMQEWAKDFAAYLKTGVVSKFMSETVDTEGGYLVPEEFRNIMIMYDAEDTLVWSKATVWPMAGEKIQFPKLQQNPDVQDAGFDHFAGVSFEWTEEGGEKAETEPTFGMVEMIVHELAGYTEITNTLLDDSVINLINYLTRLFRAAWYYYTDKSFIQGTGGKQPLGIINDPSILSVYRQTADTIEVQDCLNMESRMPSVFDSNAVWFITKQGRAALRGQTVTSSSKELVLQEMYTDLAKGYDMTILGKPAYLADGKIPALGSTGDLILATWAWYYIGFRQDFSMDSSRHFKFRNNRTALRCSGRLDGQAAIPQAFVALDASTS
jgi:HK97 family phage major capsid protein